MSRLQERLDLLRVIKSMAELPPEKEKILVIDAAQVPTNWQLGIGTDDFVPRWLEAMEDQIREIPNLWVLSSTGVDQRSWASEGLGQTAFSYYLIDALAWSRGRWRRPTQFEGSPQSRSEAGAVLGLECGGAVQEAVLLPRPRPNQGGEKTGRPAGDEGRKRSPPAGQPVRSCWPPYPVSRPRRLRNPSINSFAPRGVSSRNLTR